MLGQKQRLCIQVPPLSQVPECSQGREKKKKKRSSGQDRIDLRHGNLTGKGGDVTGRWDIQPGVVVNLDCVVIRVVIEVLLGDVRMGRVLVISIPGVLVAGGVGRVSLLEVIMAVEKLLLGFVVSGRLVKPGTRRVVTDLVLIQIPLLGLCVLVETVLMEMVPVLIELGASVTWVGSVSRTEVEASVLAGNPVVTAVEMGEVAISVVEVKMDNGTVDTEVTSLFVSTSIHGVVGEADTMVTDIDSGHWVEEERVNTVVVLVGEVIRGDMVGEVLVVSDIERVGKALTKEDLVISVLEICEEVGKDLVVVVSTELALMEDREEDIVIVGIEEEMMVLKGVITALVEVLNIGKGDEGETLKVLKGIFEVGVVIMLVVPLFATSVVGEVGKIAVMEEAKVEEVGVVSNLVVVKVLVGYGEVDEAWVVRIVGIKVDRVVVSEVPLGTGSVAGKKDDGGILVDDVRMVLVVAGVELGDV